MKKIARGGELQQGVDQSRIELSAAFSLDLGESFFQRAGGFVGSRVGQNVERVGDGRKAGGQGNVVALDCEVAGAIPVFVMVAGDLLGDFEQRKAAARENLASNRRVGLDDLELFRSQLVRLQQDVIRNADLPEVVQRGGSTDQPNFFAPDSDLFGQ